MSDLILNSRPRKDIPHKQEHSIEGVNDFSGVWRFTYGD